MNKQILYQRYVESNGIRKYDIRTTMQFDDDLISEDNARAMFLDFLKDRINDPEPLIIVDIER